MLKFVSTACAAVMALTVPFAAPASAMPMGVPAWSPNAVINVQADGSSPNTYPGNQLNRRWDRDRGRDRDRGWDRDRRSDRWDRRQERRERRAERRADRHGYWRGHRGYRDYRPGYRRHGDFWFPPAAFIAGAIIGGVIANQPSYGGGDAHVQWCYDRYRSYRASDNTFQPYNGPRRQCNSPYG